jgi:hypothetical protein
MSVFTSCDGFKKDYCSTCEKDICKINNELYVQYEMKNLAYDKMMSGTLTYEEFDVWSYTYKRADNKIEGLLESREAYENEITKHFKNYEYRPYTIRTYDMLDSLIWRSDTPGVVSPITPLH